ncbi:MAG: hypothetical protein ACYTBV_08405 [Planctomycetota bacterium]|jgi:hypothetical protein
MKRGQTISVVLVFAVIGLFCTGVSAAAEKEADRDKREAVKGRPLPEDAVERMMKRLADDDPERAKELEALRKSDPAKFQKEMKLEMRKALGRRMLEGPGRDGRVRGEPKGRRGGGIIGEGGGGRRGPDRPRGRGFDEEQMRKEYDEYLKWLKKEYPEEAAELAEMKDKSPEIYKRKLAMSYRRHNRIYEAAKRNPEYAKVLKEDAELRRQVRELVRDIKAEQDNDKKAKLTEELRGVLDKRYDIILQKMQFEYQHLLKRLEELKKQVKERESELQQRKDTEYKAKNVDERLKELLGQSKRFRWD